MPWFPFTCDQVLKPWDKRKIIEKEGPSLYSTMQTKISNNASSSVTAHAYRDGNGNSTLLIDSDTRDELVCNYSCKYDCEKVDYDTNNRVDWA